MLSIIPKSCDKTKSYIGKTKRHFAGRVEEHLFGKSAIYEHISSCRTVTPALSATFIL